MQSDRWRCSNEFWAFVEPLLPVHVNKDPLGRGRPRRDDRDAMDGILFVVRTGCQWNALNVTGICSSSTAHRRFQEWTQAGVFLRLWQDGLEVYDELIGISHLPPPNLVCYRFFVHEKRPNAHADGNASV